MTQTNVIAAVEEGARTVESIAQWVNASVNSLFPETKASFHFRGDAVFLRTR